MVNGWPTGMIPLICRGLRVAMGADAKHSGSSGIDATCQGQYMAKKTQVFELTLLFAIGGSVDVGRCPARGADAAAGGDCSRGFFQGTFNEDFIDGQSSEVIEAMLCSRRLVDLLIRQVACTYRYWSLECHDGGMVVLKCKR